MNSVSEVSEVCMRETVSVFEVKVYAYETGKGCAYTIHMCGACFMYVCMCTQWVTLHNIWAYFWEVWFGVLTLPVR